MTVMTVVEMTFGELSVVELVCSPDRGGGPQAGIVGQAATMRGVREGESMYISVVPVAAAGATVLGVKLLSASTETPRGSAVATSALHSPLVTLAGFLLVALALVLVAWTAKHPRR